MMHLLYWLKTVQLRIYIPDKYNNFILALSIPEFCIINAAYPLIVIPARLLRTVAS